MDEARNKWRYSLEVKQKSIICPIYIFASFFNIFVVKLYTISKNLLESDKVIDCFMAIQSNLYINATQGNLKIVVFVSSFPLYTG